MEPETSAETAAPLEILLGNRWAFLRFLERRIGDPALAEDILQDAFAKALALPARLPEDEALVPWFYRTLRNAAIDRLRRQGATDRALEAFARELESAGTVTDETRREVCQCISRLAATLKPEYADALQAIDVEGQPVKAYAARKGLTAGNAGVRVFRARVALRRRVVESCGTCAEHGCLDCSCHAAV